MKNFPPDLLEQTIEPLILVGVRWGSSPTYFSTKSARINGLNSQANIVAVGQYTNAKQQDGVGATASISLSIKDTNGFIKTLIDNYIIEKASATVFIAFDETGNYIPLVVGEVVGPVSWDEGSRVATFSVATVVESKEIGFSPTRDDLHDINPQAEGQSWPMIFGKCAHVPTVKARQQRVGYLQADIELFSELYDFNADAGTMTFMREDNVKVKSYFGDSASDNKIFIEGGQYFPQDEEIQIIIDGVVFKGKFQENTFTVSQTNSPKYEGKSFGSRTGTDTDRENEQLAWLDDATVDLAGHHVYLTTSDGNVWYNYCIKQEGKRCTFKNAWMDLFNTDPEARKPLKLTSSHSIERAYACSEGGLVSTELDAIYTMHAQEKRKPIPTQAAQKKQRFGVIRTMMDELKRQPGAFWSRTAGEKVRIFGADPDIYIASCVQLSQINAVYGIKKIRPVNGHEIEVFAPIPKDYYRKQLQSNYEVNGERASALLFDRPLEDRKEEGWSDRVWVTGTSTIGPDPAEIIEWVLNNYTNFRADFGNIDTGDVKMNFALLNPTDAMSFAKQLAWQARCGLRLDSGVAELVFLPQIPDTLLTFDEEVTEQDSLVLDFTETIDIKTKITARWRETQRKKRKEGKDKLANLMAATNDVEARDERFTIYKNNIESFGHIEEEWDLFAFNEGQYVDKVLEYWGFIASNSWRKVTLRCFHRGIACQPWDGVWMDYQNQKLGSLGGLVGIVESVQYDFDSKSTTLVIWLASRTGSFANDNRVFNG